MALPQELQIIVADTTPSVTGCLSSAASGVCFVAIGTGAVVGRNGYSKVEIKSGIGYNNSNDYLEKTFEKVLK